MQEIVHRIRFLFSIDDFGCEPSPTAQGYFFNSPGDYSLLFSCLLLVEPLSLLVSLLLELLSLLVSLLVELLSLLVSLLVELLSLPAPLLVELLSLPAPLPVELLSARSSAC